MLKLKHLFENYDLAEQALSHWEHDSSNLAGMLSQYRISSNAIYPFSSAGKTCFLRLAPNEEKLQQNILGELEFIGYLNEMGFPALEPLRTKTDGVLMTIRTEWGNYYATAFQKVRGIQIERTNYADDIMVAYGKALGKLHTLSSEFVPTVKKWSHINVLEWIEHTLCEYQAIDPIRFELTAVKKEFDMLAIHKDNYGLIHYDFEPDNVFYDEATKTCAVIDFDDGMYHWYALDIEQVFDSLRDELSETSYERAKKAFIEGYMAEHCYTKEMSATRPLMRRFMNLYSYARLIRSTAEKLNDEPKWLIDLRSKLNKMILNLEAEIIK